MNRNGGRIQALVMQMQNDFLDTPALALTVAQAQRRFGVDAATCEAILGALVDAHVLTLAPTGVYRRWFPRPLDASPFGQHAA